LLSSTTFEVDKNPTWIRITYAISTIQYPTNEIQTLMFDVIFHFEFNDVHILDPNLDMLLFTTCIVHITRFDLKQHFDLFLIKI
jgi:hypothetical protein